MYYVYFLQLSNKKTYIGSTSNLKGRLLKHSKGQVSSTKGSLPVRLVAYFAFRNKHISFKFEKYLKSGSGRAFTKKHELVEVWFCPKIPLALQFPLW
ncbi:MAG: GIY-YIG nuclease family protein [Candidatus Curtissbacteria bacterium]|nr:GIY-YIG nuclease family protein [Candidatus Curtissbacteria bacterium]